MSAEPTTDDKIKQAVERFPGYDFHLLYSHRYGHWTASAFNSTEDMAALAQVLWR